MKILFPDTVRYNGGARKVSKNSIASSLGKNADKGDTPKVKNDKKNKKMKKLMKSDFLRQKAQKKIFQLFFSFF